MHESTDPPDVLKYCPRCGSPEFDGKRGKNAFRCQACDFQLFLNSACAVAGLVYKKNDVLFLRRSKEPAKGTLDLPGGFVDPTESAEEAMARELYEETGLAVKSLQFLFTIPNEYLFSGITVHTTDIVFEILSENTEVVLNQNENDDYYWVDPNKIDPQEIGLKSMRQAIERCRRSPSNGVQ